MNEIVENIRKDLISVEARISQIDALISTEKDQELLKYVLEEKESLLKQKKDLLESIASITSSSEERTKSGSYSRRASLDASDSHDVKEGQGLDPNTAILEVRAGTGGDEAGIFANDLLNMYLRCAEKNGWKTNELIMSRPSTNEIRNATIEIKGANAYQALKNESGVHRVQRVPVTESAGRIHTSTATVAVLPFVSLVEVEIDPKDIKLEFFHSSGHGGQNVNKVQTAVRIYHLPTGVVVESQEQRNQAQNREKAMQILRSRLYEAMREQQKTKVNELRADQIGKGKRSEKIRTYNFPQDRVTDHRIKKSYHNIPSLLNGNIEEIIADLQLLGDNTESLTLLP